MALKAKTNRRKTEGKEAALLEATKEETKRLNLDVPESLHRQLKSKAAGEGKTMKDVVMTAIQDYLSK